MRRTISVGIVTVIVSSQAAALASDAQLLKPRHRAASIITGRNSVPSVARATLSDRIFGAWHFGRPRRSRGSHHFSLLPDLNLRVARRPCGGAAPS